METVNIHDAKTRLSQLIADAVKGKPFVIAKAGKPLVKVERLEEAIPKGKRKLGFMVGQGHVPEDFDTMFQDEIEQMFYGDDD